MMSSETFQELFQTVDRSHRGKVALSSLQEILHNALARDFKSEPHNWHKIVDTLELVSRCRVETKNNNTSLLFSLDLFTGSLKQGLIC